MIIFIIIINIIIDIVIIVVMIIFTIIVIIVILINLTVTGILEKMEGSSKQGIQSAWSTPIRHAK